MKTKKLITALLFIVLSASCVPGGHFIVYSASSDESSVNLYLVNTKSAENQQITDLKYANYPSWSPDGKRIVFSSSNGLFFISTKNKTDITKIADTPNFEINPSWSPDGSKIAFISQSIDNSSLFDLMVVNVDGTGLKTIASNLGELDYYHTFSWSPDGKKLVFSFPSENSREIFVADSDGSNQKQITDLSSSLPKYTPPIQPTWSPDGTKLAFVTWDLYVINSDGSELKKLIDMKSGDYSAFSDPVWSPNGEYIVCEGVTGKIYVIKSDGTSIRKLAGEGTFYSGSDPWSPESDTIAYMTAENGNIDMYTIDI